MAEHVGVRPENVLPVRSRVSWSAIFAGAVMALAVYLVLTLLGAAVGLSVSDRVGVEALGIGGTLWAVLSTILALFIGGCVTAHTAVGETKMEAVVHGVLMWGVVFAVFFWMVGIGVRSGFNAMVGMAYLNESLDRPITADSWEDAARKAGVTQDQLDAFRGKITPHSVRQALNDPKERQAALTTATWLTWWTLAGTVLSIAAAIGGALAGAGPTLQFLTVRARVPARQMQTQNVH